MSLYNRISGSFSYRKKQFELVILFKRIAKFLKKKGVRLLYVELPIDNKLVGLTDFEKERIKDWSFDLNKYREELPKLKKLFGEDVTMDYILSVFDGGIVVQGNKRKVLLDFTSPNQHIVNGRRVTVGQPKDYHNTIYTHGACTWRGTGVEDKDTIASLLQSQINDYYPNSYRVVNSAIGRGSTLYDDFEVMKEQQYREGDIVVFGTFGGYVNSLPKSMFKQLGIEFIETSHLFARPHNYGEWFNDDPLHTNHRGNKVIANYIFKVLESIKWLSKEGKNQKSVSLYNEKLTTGERIYGDNPELLKYIDSIKPLKKGDANSKNGGIVMNCNPFTLGHRYLIEYAAARVDYLYIFVFCITYYK